MKVTRKIIEIDEELCNGCGECVLSCAEGAIQIVNGTARVIADMYCDGLGACIGECPMDALKIIEREADEFDEEAVEELLEKQKTAEKKPAPTMACGCPSTQIQSLGTPSPCQQANAPQTTGSTESALTHWPIQIRLVPPTAPFLKNAELLVLADCVPVAFPTLHRDLLQGKAVMMGCPKFDDVQEYIDKFAAIFKEAGIKRVTTVVMEVPCCAGLPVIVKKGIEASGVEVPMDEVVISVRGKILRNDAA
jgi:Pyruvate/2-oxoacid:ferredoxin oxidoreductase delta subunit